MEWVSDDGKQPPCKEKWQACAEELPPRSWAACQDHARKRLTHLLSSWKPTNTQAKTNTQARKRQKKPKPVKKVDGAEVLRGQIGDEAFEARKAAAEADHEAEQRERNGIYLLLL